MTSPIERRDPEDKTVLTLQLVAVLMVCLNHFSITTMHGLGGLLSPRIATDPAVWGLGFLFFSSGFLTHRRRAILLPSGHWHDRVGFILGRYLRLVLPVMAIVAVDMQIVAHATVGSAASTWWVLPSMITLSQTWVHNVIGSTSLGLPMAAANMAWLSSDLFFLSILYALFGPLVPKLPGRLLVLGGVILGLAYAGWFATLAIQESRILASSAARFGSSLAPVYSLWSWLFEYAPYAHVLSFLMGALLAEIAERRGRVPAPFIVLGVMLAVVGNGNPAGYLGINILVLSLIVHFGRTRTAEDPPPVSRLEGIRSLVDKVSPYAYEIYVLHLGVMLPFTLAADLPLTFWTLLYGVLRSLAVVGLMLILVYGVAKLVFGPIRGWLGRALGLNTGVEDLYV